MMIELLAGDAHVDDKASMPLTREFGICDKKMTMKLSTTATTIIIIIIMTMIIMIILCKRKSCCQY